MGSIAYKKFFSVNASHDFYMSGLSKDFSIVPTSKTREKIRDQRLIFRPLATGIKMFYRSVSRLDATPFLPIEDGVYSFAMTLKNKLEFINVTELDESPTNTYASGKILYIRNTTTTTNGLTTELLNRLMPEQFTYDFVIATPVNVKIQILDFSGTVIYTSPIALVPDDTGTGFHAPVDLREFGPGKFTIETYNNNLGTLVSSEEMYVDGTLIGKDVFGIIDIELKTNVITFAQFTALNPFPATVLFTRRLSQWKYFIINKTKNPTFLSATFTIVDERGTLLLPYSTSVYGALGSPYAFGAEVVESNINSYETISITSSSNIPFFEESFPNLVLKKNAATVLESLPNPTRTVVSADPTDYSITCIFIYI